MKKRTIIAILACAALDGCQSSTTGTTDAVQQATQADAAYTGAINSIVDAEQAGLMTPAQVASLQPYRAAAQSAVNALSQDAQANNTSKFSQDLSAFNAAMAKLSAEKTATTKP